MAHQSLSDSSVVLDVLSQPWVFTQSPPLTTSDLSSEARRRRLDLDEKMLRELYRHRDLVPLAEITHRKVATPRPVVTAPRAGSSVASELRTALADGRVRDLGSEPFRPRLRFGNRRMDDPSRWWNGLVYSRWQLLAVSALRRRVATRTLRGPATARRLALAPPSEWERTTAARDLAVVLTAIEARYLPVAEPEWLHLVNTEVDEWQKYRDSFDPVGLARLLSVSREHVVDRAERLLLDAHWMDQTGDWSRLIRRATPEKWKSLSGDVLVAMDHRLAAEMLLMFAEDLGAVPVRPEGSRVWHPWDERLTAGRHESLDELLVDLGISPHTRVVLAVEGETEELLVPRVFSVLGLRQSPDLVRIMCLRGANKDLALLAAASIAPLLGQRRNDDTFDLIRPPTRLLIALDQDEPWDTEAQVAKQLRKITSEVQKVVKAQGGLLAPEELDYLVQIRQWPARCFEFAHFSDSELLHVLRAIHPDCGGLSDSDLAMAIGAARAKSEDVKRVWSGWSPRVSKVELAEALWPTLEAKILAALTEPAAAVPPVADVVSEAHGMAQQLSRGRFVLPARPLSDLKD